MADNPNKNSWQNKAENQEVGQNQPIIPSAPSVPPPPLEVKIRTMESDLESMAKSGGGGMVPRGESVRAPAVMSAEDAARELKRRSNAVWRVVVPVFLVILLGVLAFVLYNFFVNSSKLPTAATTAGSENQGNGPAVPQFPAVSSSAPLGQTFVHASFFRKPADEILNVFAQTAAANASDLKTFSQKLAEAVAAASSTHDFFELNAKSADGRDLNASGILSATDASVLDSQFLADHFNPDITFFAFRDKQGIWPGYILEFKPAENWIFLKSDVAKLENSPKLENLFLSSPGALSTNGFKDSIIGNQPVRALKFGNRETAFVYGRLVNYLIFSTSVEGFAKAIALLQ